MYVKSALCHLMIAAIVTTMERIVAMSTVDWTTVQTITTAKMWITAVMAKTTTVTAAVPAVAAIITMTITVSVTEAEDTTFIGLFLLQSANILRLGNRC